MFPWLRRPLLSAGHSNSAPGITTTYDNFTIGQGLKYQYLRECLLFLLRVQSTIRHSERIVAADWYSQKLDIYVTASGVLFYCFLQYEYYTRRKLYSSSLLQNAIWVHFEISLTVVAMGTDTMKITKIVIFQENLKKYCIWTPKKYWTLCIKSNFYPI